ncbi:hypothetical protein OTB20_33985 [Streptomyces sp. H27-H1]|uniref:hypothetical protein n=1 Tax=Streptomyces sp. H27-H1 TaxID=2996461 RepID=UPI00227039B8|nr:hypothetical protein [Streptomyces sp. H27-H1]MCY0931108.1 hypothetical protein [Streptomyces sp. H27-H1]
MVTWPNFGVSAAGCRELLATTGVFAGLSSGVGWQVSQYLRARSPEGGRSSSWRRTGPPVRGHGLPTPEGPVAQDPG